MEFEEMLRDVDSVRDATGVEAELSMAGSEGGFHPDDFSVARQAR